ncbi:MAG: gliding motility-associated C-terminal domain-containing protein [Bacteroidales bacterium]|nr:gliding motility-associated C-terminal domain-containing protein [Bacteroidales bacterium]
MKYLGAIILSIIAMPLAGQITAPGSGAVRTTAYPGGYTPNHPVFIYCSDGTTTATLNVGSPGGTAPYTFDWSVWSTADNGFTIPLKTDAGVATSSATGLAEGGYRVHITDGATYDTTLIAWVHLARPTAQASLLDRRCDWVALKGVAAADTFYYYQPVTGAQVRLPASRTFLWSSTPASTIPYPTLEVSPVTYVPPLEDVTYKLQVTDEFGCTAESSFFYESIHVKADFSADPVEGEAPLEVQFTDKSIRASTYTWKFGNDSLSYDAGSTAHTYYKPGSYDVTLIIESDLNCVDSLVFQQIIVEPSKLSIPNVFTPDGDGLNEHFRPDVASLRFLDMQIFSRSGLLVYSFRGEGDRLRDWPGWNGNVNESSVKAAPGVYFYVIRAIGWDNVVYETKEHRGFLYLYR